MSSTTSLGRPNNAVPGRQMGSGTHFSPPAPVDPPLPRLRSPEPGISTPEIAPEEMTVRIPIEPDRGPYLRYGKRALDLLAAAAAIILLFPVFLLTALAIKLDTPGPVFYRSTRVGRGGRTFTFYKLRSMIHGAEHHRHRIAHLNEVSGPVFKIARDPRITRVGRFLRRTSMDELPQFWNVLVGDMTLVGPRPPLPDEVEKYEPWQLRRLSVRPGITCLWQISGRSRLGFDEWMRLDMEYIERRSLGLDLKILAQTIPAVLSGQGAY